MAGVIPEVISDSEKQAGGAGGDSWWAFRGGANFYIEYLGSMGAEIKGRGGLEGRKVNRIFPLCFEFGLFKMASILSRSPTYPDEEELWRKVRGHVEGHFFQFLGDLEDRGDRKPDPCIAISFHFIAFTITSFP